MTTFAAYASNFEIYPNDGEASLHLHPLLGSLQRVEFHLRMDDPDVNQGQMQSDFAAALERALLQLGTVAFNLRLPIDVPQELDFAFSYGGRTVAVEIEKANREKILRDILKCHSTFTPALTMRSSGCRRTTATNTGFGTFSIRCKAIG